MEILVVEGTTEKIYFDRLGKIIDIPIHSIDCRGGDIPKIKNACKNEISKMKKGDTFDIVMDVDNTPVKDIREFAEWCLKRGIRIYLSNPSFEVFLLMHYSDVKASLNQKDLEESLSHKLKTKYDKSTGIPLKITMVSAAICRGKKAIADPLTALDCCLSKRGTTMAHMLVEELINKSKDTIHKNNR